LRSAITTLNI